MAEDFAAAEARLGDPLPDDLRAFLAATDGLEDEEGFDYGWSLDKIVSQNSRAWSDGDAPLDRDLLGSAKTGVAAGSSSNADQSQAAYFTGRGYDLAAHPVAPDLLTFWQGWLQGSIKV